ncbi:MAG: hypothetical protein AAF752_03875 [Bacteroidota bacterium]
MSEAHDDTIDDEGAIVGETRAVGGGPKSTAPPALRKPLANSHDPFSEDVMEDLASEYSRFAQLVARGKVQPQDYKVIRATINSVLASADTLEAEVKRRRTIALRIQSSVEFIENNPTGGPEHAAPDSAKKES